MKAKLIKQLIAVVISFGVIIGAGLYIRKMPKPEIQNTETPTSTVIEEDEIPKNSDLNNLKLNLVSTYTIPYRNVCLGGHNLIDGSYAKRMVLVFTATGVKDLNTAFKGLQIYVGDRLIPINIMAKQYNKDEVLIVCTCDNTINIDNMVVSVNVTDPSNGELLTFTKELGNEELIVSDVVAGGELMQTQEEGYWHRLENSDPVNGISKNGDSGLYYEYTRTLNFLSFGFYNNINVENLQFKTNLEYDYDVSFDVKELVGDEYIPYKNEHTTSPKQLIVTIKVYTNQMTEDINTQIADTIEKSDIIYNNTTLHITDGFIVATEYDS